MARPDDGILPDLEDYLAKKASTLRIVGAEGKRFVERTHLLIRAPL
jgi:hypothetical protein